MGAREVGAGRVSRGRKRVARVSSLRSPQGEAGPHCSFPADCWGHPLQCPEGSRGPVGGLAAPARQVLPTA